MTYERKRGMEQAPKVQPPERHKIIPSCSGCGKPWDDCKGVCAKLKDPGEGTIVIIEFEDEEKAKTFRDWIKKDGIEIYWGPIDQREVSLVWLAGNDSD